MSFSDPRKNIAQLGISEGMVVADFGAGAGHYAVAAAEAVGESGLVYVVDIQRELLTKVKHVATAEQQARMRFVCADLENENGSGLTDACCDVVVVSNLLFQVDNKQAVLKEAYRLLRQGGRLLLVDWSGSYGNLGPPEERVLDIDSAQTLATDLGFVARSEIDAGAYHYGLVLQKNA